MPIRPMTICRRTGCGKAIARPGYCEAHKSDERQWDNNHRAKRRQEKRALKTNSSAWLRLRDQVLNVQPFCSVCRIPKCKGDRMAVDHINGDKMDNRLENLQPLCRSCHSEKTAREDGGFGNARVGAGQKSTASPSDSRPQSDFCVRKFQRGGI